MKKLCIAIALVGAMSAPQLFGAYDGTITFNGSANSNPFGGGIFIVSSTSPTLGTPDLGSFQTFCLEYNEHFNPNGFTYNYRINDGSVAGGVAGVDGVDTTTTLTKDSVSLGTAYLYSQFRASTLSGFVDSATSGVELQAAIWWLEQEGAPGEARNHFIDTAETALGLTHDAIGDAALRAASGGAYGVVALNLFDGVGAQVKVGANGQSYSVNQDMLGIVPEPSTIMAGALLLLPFGASTIRILRKNRIV